MENLRTRQPAHRQTNHLHDTRLSSEYERPSYIRSDDQSTLTHIFDNESFTAAHGAVNGLLEEYFDAVHWFSLVVYEPKFRKMFCSIADGFAYHLQRLFIMLLAMVLGMAAWYRSQRGGPDPTIGENGARTCSNWSILTWWS